ncbi:hemopexin repeat-containing protein [Amycolatopsis coloradensis]|nr:hemopexin repeat-containing protein [Amycolatopsis coloradensis]
MPMPDSKFHKINAAYALTKAEVINERGGYEIRDDVIVLVQNGTASVAEVKDRKISRWQPAYTPYGFPKATAVLKPHSNLPNPFTQGIDTVFPDYDVGDGRCWVTNGGKIVSYNFKTNKKYGDAQDVKSKFTSIPSGFANGWNAALTCSKNKVWLFNGDKFTALIQDGSTISFSDPKTIAEGWKKGNEQVPLIKDGIDAAVRIPGTNTGYLFRGDKYVEVNTDTGNVVGGEKLIRSYWHGVPYLYPTPDAILRTWRGNEQVFRIVWGRWCFELTRDQMHWSRPPVSTGDAKLLSEVYPKLKDSGYADGVQRGFMPNRGSSEESAYFLRGDKYVTARAGETGSVSENSIGGSLTADNLIPHFTATSSSSIFDSYLKNEKEMRYWEPGKGASRSSGWLSNVRNKLAGSFMDNLQATSRIVLRSYAPADTDIIMISTEPRVAIAFALPGKDKIIHGPHVFNHELPWPTS